jgi:hypothetical protein
LTRKKVENTSEETTSLEDVWSVLNFAQQAYTGQFPGIYTPQLVNSKMKDITLSPQLATAAKIDEALSNPSDNEESLIGYTQWMELNSMIFKRLLRFFSGLMSWNFLYSCKNADKEDYSSAAYKKDLNIFRDFTDKFDVKKEFQTCIEEMMRSETYFGILREDGEKALLQELNHKYCIITGRTDFGFTYDFNMVYFMQPSVSLDLFPDIFKKMYNDVYYINGKPTNLYDPSTSLSARNGVFALWHQTSPYDGFTAFKFTPAISSQIPFLSPLMPNAVLEPIIRGLQTNSYIQQASKLIFSEVPMLKETQAKVKDQISISADTLGRFLALVQAALPSAIKMAAAPVVNTQSLEFTGSDKLYSSFLQTLAASSGTNSRLLYSIDRQNILETKLSTDIDLNILRPVYNQFSDFMNFTINRKTKKFKFKLWFDGFETSVNREERMNKANALADKGIVIDQLFALAADINPFDFRRMLEETKANKFVDGLTPILNSAQLSGKMNGRPKSSDSSLSDSGAQTRGDGSDDEKNEE